MILSAEEVVRSLRGTMALLNRRAEGLKAFDMSEAGFWRSFGAIWLTLPAYVVCLSFERYRLGAADGGSVLGDPMLLALVAGGFVAAFLALPVVMIWLARRLQVSAGYAPFVIVTNWIVAVALTMLSLPQALLMLGWATPALAVLYTAAFSIIVLRLEWIAATATLGVSGRVAGAIVLVGISLHLTIAGTVDALAA
jgi:hypothetical protein